MSSDSREQFLIGLEAFRNATDVTEVRSSDRTGDFLRRGLVVASYNLLETFIADRMVEIASVVNAGSTQFLDLPESFQKRAIINTVAVANSQMRRGSSDLHELREHSREVGESLSAVGRSLSLSSRAWLWSGSNMAAEDYASILRLFHIGNPWKEVWSLAKRLSFRTEDYNGEPIDYFADLKTMARERHLCAHSASHGVTAIELRAIPSRILLFGSVFDLLVSCAAERLRDGDADFLSDNKMMDGSLVKLRFVRPRNRGNQYVEILEMQNRAKAVGTDMNSVVQVALRNCKKGEALVSQSQELDLLSWATPRANA